MRKFKKEMKSIFLFGFILFLFSSPIWAQQKRITGTVKDAIGEPIIGASIMIKGTSNGTVTNVDGQFSLLVNNETDVIVISFIGFENLERPADKETINVILKESFTNLDDVVVIGYGTAKRGDLTGSIASVGEKALKDIPVTSALQAMSGRMAGVNITVTEGSPDAEIKIRVRGGGSITQDNSPLYIVDGFQVSSINDIPPGDIQSIDVLKDASSTAIYGAQGANGVVLVTTKSGRAGKTEINFNSYIGIKQVYNLTEVLSPYEYVYYQRELDSSTSDKASFFSMYGSWDDLDIYKSKEGINWQDELFGNIGIQHNYNASVTGGSESLRYNLTYTHDDEDFIMMNSTYKRDYLRLKINKNISKNLDFDFSARMSNKVITGPSVSSGKKLRDAVKYAPVMSLSHIDESALSGTEDNTSAEALSALNDPLYNVKNEYKDQNSFTNSYDAGVSWKILKGLTFRTQGSYRFVMDYTDNIWLKKTGESSRNGGKPVAKREDKKGRSWSVQNTLSYKFKLGDAHEFNLLAGQEVYSSYTNTMLTQSKFYPEDFSANDVLAMWNYGEPQPTYTTIGEPSRTSSVFGRLNYSLNDKYIFTAIAREDGKNVFAPGKRWGFFPGAAFAWKLSNEEFMSGTSKWLSNAKIRLSYGEVGNARVGSYWRQLYSFQTSANKLYYVNEGVQSAMQTSTTLRNENLTWETTLSTNVGVDLGFFNQRLTLTVDAYKNTTKDLILAVELPSNSGYSRQYQNVGSTSNTGLEFSATGYIVDNEDFKLSANFNISFNKNRIEELNGSDGIIASSGWGLLLGSNDYRAMVGESVGQIYGYKVDGMYSFNDFTYNETQKKWILNEGVVDCSGVITTSGNWYGPGHIKLKDLGGEEENVITEGDDRTVIGNAMPIHIGGFGVNATYKGFDFSALFNWSYGNDIYNANKIDYTSYTGSKKYQNLSSTMSLENRFSTIDPETGYNIMYGDEANPELLKEINKDAKIWHPLTNTSVLTDWAIEDGSFIRLSNLTFGYTLPSKLSNKVLMKKLRMYVTAYNLKCWTNYTGQDPEVDTRRSTPLTPGVDYSAYPKAKTLLFGVNVTF